MATNYLCPEELKDSRIIVADIETTGLNPLYNTIIELGVVEFNGGEITRQYSKLFGGGRSSVYLVRKIHGIKDSERIGKPTFKESAAKIAEYFKNSIIVTHNGYKFDIPFMECAMNEVGVKLEYDAHIDTYAISRKLKHKSNKLENLCHQYDIPYDESNHRGLTDCLCTAQLLFAFVKNFGLEKMLD